MLLIEPGENSHLPETYRSIHNICAVLYDHLVEVVKSDDYEELRATTFSLEGKPESLDTADIEQLFEWFTSSGKHAEMTAFLTKQITCAVLSDFLQFVYESLNSSGKGKFSVAYALSRKPFIDELLIFEQILNDNDEFIKRYYFQGQTSLYDPSNRKLDKKSIIKEAVSKVTFNSMFSDDFIYELRYDKAAKHGLNWISNQALHIVTTDPNYRTEDKSLNFVFSIKDDFEKYWYHYYRNLAYLLFYTAAVIDEIVFQYLPDLAQLKSVKATKRFITFVVFSEVLGEGTPENSQQIVNAISSLFEHKCKMCSTDIKFNLDDFVQFIFEDVLVCPACNTDQFADPEFMVKFLSLSGR
jgi:hypothetical protein